MPGKTSWNPFKKAPPPPVVQPRVAPPRLTCDQQIEKLDEYKLNLEMKRLKLISADKRNTQAAIKAKLNGRNSEAKQLALAAQTARNTTSFLQDNSVRMERLKCQFIQDDVTNVVAQALNDSVQMQEQNQQSVGDMGKTVDRFAKNRIKRNNDMKLLADYETTFDALDQMEDNEDTVECDVERQIQAEVAQRQGQTRLPEVQQPQQAPQQVRFPVVAAE